MRDLRNRRSLKSKLIGDRAFYACEWLYEISLPDSVRHIGSDAFSACYHLARVIVRRGSRAEAYCRRNDLPCVYADAEMQ